MEHIVSNTYVHLLEWQLQIRQLKFIKDDYKLFNAEALSISQIDGQIIILINDKTMIHVEHATTET